MPDIKAINGAKAIVTDRQKPAASNPIAPEASKAPSAGLVSNPALQAQPVLPSDYLSEADLQRYQQVQHEWAKGMAKALETTPETVLARVAPVQLADAPSILKDRLVGSFNPQANVILFNPIREVACANGGDEAKIVHESTHSFLHSLRLAYVRQVGDQQLLQDCSQTVASNMLNGELGLILSDLKEIEINGQKAAFPEFMQAPPLSAAERQAVIDTINALKMEHLEVNKASINLNAAGKELVRTTLIPRLGSFANLFEGYGVSQEQLTERMSKYISSFYNRRSYMYNNLSSNNFANLSPEVLKSLDIPLNEKEMNLARYAVSGFLGTQEGNMLRSLSIGTAEAGKKYYNSYEELFARFEETEFRMQKVKQEIEKFRLQGYEPPASLIAQYKTVSHNTSCLNLALKLARVENEMIIAPKDPNALRALLTHPVYRDINMTPNIVERIDKIKTAQVNNGSSEEGFAQDMGMQLTEVKNGKKLANEYDELISPVNLLADTPENQDLKTRYNKILSRLRKIVFGTDFTDLPASFYPNREAAIQREQKVLDLMVKWAKRIHV